MRVLPRRQARPEPFWGTIGPRFRYSTAPREEPGINGGVLCRRRVAPADGQAVNASVCTTGVVSVDAFVDQAVRAGASVARPRLPFSGVGWLADCTGTEGNIFGIMQDDRNAA